MYSAYVYINCGFYSQISIGAGISLTSIQWDALQCQKKHSLFVKGLAVAVWGTGNLKDRSVEGKVCPRYKSTREARAPLSPQKVKAMKGMCIQFHWFRVEHKFINNYCSFRQTNLKMNYPIF